MTVIKQLSALTLLFNTCIASAGTMGPTENLVYYPKEGPYFGLGVGAAINQDKLSVQNIVNGYTVNIKSNNTYTLANVFLGYGHTYNNSFYLGAEGSIYSPRRTVFKNVPGVVTRTDYFDDKYTIFNYLNLDLLPGYRINPKTLIYARAGLGFRITQFNQQAFSLARQNIADTNNSVDGRFGAGLTYGLTNHWATSVDYFYTYAPQFNTTSPYGSAEYNFKSSTNYIGISMVYTI